jgi:autotransporter-associated beta strand protein
MASTYTGTTTVNGGTLRIENLLANGGGDLKNTPGSVFNINNGTALVIHTDVGGNNRSISNDDTFTFDSNGGGTLEWSNGNVLMQGAYYHRFVTSGGLQNIMTTTNGAYLNGQGLGILEFTVADGSDAVDLLVSSRIDNALISKNGTGTMSLTTSTTGSYNITIEAGTLDVGGSAQLAGGTFSANLTTNGTFSYSSSADQTISGVISGTGAIAKNGASTLTLSGSNSYSGGTTLNTGTLVIGNAAAAGTGTITQTDGTSLLKLDTTGTIANAMSIYNVASNKTVTLTGAITAQNTTYDVADGTTLSLNGTISGSGGVTKDGNGTLELNAANTFTGDTVVNDGTLEANASGALASTGNITVHNGGSLLVTASNAIGDSTDMELAGGTLEFNGNVSDTIGALTLSANSVIDMGGGNIALEFADLVEGLTNTTRLNIYNYTLYSDHLYFTSDANLASSLEYISFYSDFGTTFIGNSFISSFSSPWQVQPVPEPETWATAALLLGGMGIAYLKRKRRNATAS